MFVSAYLVSECLIARELTSLFLGTSLLQGAFVNVMGRDCQDVLAQHLENLSKPEFYVQPGRGKGGSRQRRGAGDHRDRRSCVCGVRVHHAPAALLLPEPRVRHRPGAPCALASAVPRLGFFCTNHIIVTQPLCVHGGTCWVCCICCHCHISIVASAHRATHVKCSTLVGTREAASDEAWVLRRRCCSAWRARRRSRR